MITIAHQYSMNPTDIGGINTWIRDYLDFTTQPCRVVCLDSQNLDLLIQTKLSKHEFFPIISVKKRRVVIPDSLRFSLSLILNRKLLTNKIQVHRVEYVPLLKIISPKSKIQLFVHTDSTLALSNMSDSLWKNLKFLYFFVEKMALKFADEVHVYSRTDFDRVKRIQPKAILETAWYNDLVFKLPNEETLRNKIIWVGRLEKPKNPILAVNVFSELKEISNDFRFQIIGSGSLLDDVRNEIIQLGMEMDIELVPPLQNFDLAKVLHSTAVLIQTSVFEGAPRILIEALACGAAIVSNVSGDPENLLDSEDFGVRTESNTVEDFRVAILNALNLSPVSGNSLQNIRGASTKVAMFENFSG
jgi:glycosyltransferase involved in cell wall biosynthesis